MTIPWKLLGSFTFLFSERRPNTHYITHSDYIADSEDPDQCLILR